MRPNSPCTAPRSTASSSVTASVAGTSGRARTSTASALRTSSGSSTDSPPSPRNRIGPASNGRTVPSSTLCTASRVNVGRTTSKGTSTGRADGQCARTADTAAPRSDSRRPALGSIAYGSTPPSASPEGRKAMPPSTAGRLIRSWARRPSATLTAWSSTVVTSGTSRPPKSEVMRSHGDHGCPPARSTVAAQSTPSPASAGSNDASTSPARSSTARCTSGPRSRRRRSCASSRSSPPMSTPATVTPRGTSPNSVSRSTTYTIARRPVRAPSATRALPSLRRQRRSGTTQVGASSVGANPASRSSANGSSSGSST